MAEERNKITIDNDTIESIKKNSNNFSFISTFFELVGNKNFKSAEVDTLYNNVDSSSTSIWRSLSAISEKLGQTFYSNILNFLDNIDNVDLCKIQQLQSIINNLGVQYTIFNDIKYMPLDIVNVLDILSIKREYLTDSKKLDENFISKQLSSCYYDDSCMIDRLSSVCKSINESREEILKYNSSIDYYTNNITYQLCLSDELLNEFETNVYYKILKDKIEQTYNDVSETKIYKTLSAEILLSDFVLPNNKQSQIIEYKLLNNIPNDFNVIQEVDNIENGNTVLSDYSLLEYGALSIEIQRRKEAYDITQLKTRYKYYREKELQEYTFFIQNEYNSSTLRTNYVKNNRYDVDTKYIEVYQNTQHINNIQRLFNLNQIGNISYDLNMISAVASQLTQITNAIRDIREQVKVQSQKQFMYGTSSFLKYVIQEYIKNNVIQSLKVAQYLDDYKFSVDDTDVNIIEYEDSTNYNNISTYVDDMISASTNPKYWNSASKSKVIGAIDTTDLFKKVPTLEINNGIFTIDKISSLYFDILNNKFDIQQYDISTQLDAMNEFLYSLFEIGADSAFLSDNIVHTYDSKQAEEEYQTASEYNTNFVNDIVSNYNYISANGYEYLLSVDQHNTTLSAQLNYLKNELVPVTRSYVLNSIKNLINRLKETNDIVLVLPLSDMSHELTYKYSRKTYAKYDAYQNALMTDSYTKYVEYKNAENKMTLQYTNISTSYYNLLDFYEIDTYVHNSLKVTNRMVSSQLSDIYDNIFTQISDETRQVSAVDKFNVLCTDISTANELSSEIEFTSLLETLSSKYDLLVGDAKNAYDDIKSSDIYKYRKTIYDNYTNNASNDNAYYYIENTDHPSYALHPFIENYIEKVSKINVINDLVNIDVETLPSILSNSVHNIVDNNGYVVSVQYNIANSNTDYITRYEHESFLNNNNKDKSVVQSYDGFAYPRAAFELSNNTEYVISVTTENAETIELKGNFITSLSGKEEDGVYYSWNPWYRHLDLSQNERQRIASQISALKADIIDVLSGKYDIYRYGLDFYKNSYCLIKEKTDDEIEFKNSSGQLWIRIKDNPIPLPAYVFRRNDTSAMIEKNAEYSVDENISQITDNDNSNLEYMNFMLGTLKSKHQYYDGNGNLSTTYYRTPLYQDFTFSNDKNILITNGCIKNINAVYPIILKIEKSYDAGLEQSYLHHVKINNGDQYVSIVDINTLKNYMSSWTFETYFYNNDLIGTIYSSIASYDLDNESTNTDISIRGAYYEYGSKTQVASLAPISVDSMCCLKDYAPENICIDTNKYKVTVAYIVPREDVLLNYLDREVNYNDVSCLSDCNYAIKTKLYDIGENEFIELNTKYYQQYTDIGYYGILSGCNNLGNTYIGRNEIKNRGIYNIQLVSQPNAVCEFKISEKATLENISVSWKYDNNNNIHLVFDNVTDIPTGDAKCLSVFDVATDYLDPTNRNILEVVYVKNVSDNKPKFILSSYNVVSSIYTCFITEKSSLNDNISCIKTEKNDNVIINEYIK